MWSAAMGICLGPSLISDRRRSRLVPAPRLRAMRDHMMDTALIYFGRQATMRMVKDAT